MSVITVNVENQLNKLILIADAANDGNDDG